MTIDVSELIPQETAAVNSRWRRIVTPIPVPESVPVIERLRSVEPQSMAGMPPILWHEANGFLVRDPFGNQWIDLTSGIIVTNAGHSHPRILDAIRPATDRRLLATYAFPSQARLQLLEKLVVLSPIPDSKAILFCSGTEATECAMTVMRRHGQQRHSGKTGILSFVGSFHGRTLAVSLAGGTEQPSDWIDRADVHHFHVPFPDCPQFFESHVRPLLVRRCYECHSSKAKTIEGGLRLDSSAGWRRGGDTGPAIVPGKPAESRLLKAVLYQDPNLAMPPDNALAKREIDLLRKWIKMGAPDPRTVEEKVGPRVINFGKTLANCSSFRCR